MNCAPGSSSTPRKTGNIAATSRWSSISRSSRSWQRTLYDGGWAGISWPREYGGRGASLMQQVIFWQELALAGAPPMANVLGLGMVGPTIIAFGTEAQKARFLPEDSQRR